MRLTAEELATIRRLVAEAYGPEAEIRLFGSQVDPRGKGGDIDLLVELPASALVDIWRELRLHTALEEGLGGRKVDLIVHRRGEEEGPLVRIAKREGLRL
jgi:predicted nucleotidyltransferase